MQHRNLIIGGLAAGVLLVGGLAWSAASATNSKTITSTKPTEQIASKGCGCGSSSCGAKQTETGQTSCGCRKGAAGQSANFVDTNKNGICDRAE